MNIPLHRRLQSAAVIAAFFCQTLIPLLAAAGVPQLMNYQGRVTVAGNNFDGTGYFKFSLVDGGSDQNRTAAATCTITSSGRVSGVTVTDGGKGYVSPPAVSFAGTGTGATATATITGGLVASVNVTTAGGGYSTLTPTQVVFTAPPPNVQTTTLWSNDGSVSLGNQPHAAVSLTVTKGLYSVLLGDTDLMRALPPQIFANGDLRLRVWFSQEEGGPFTLLTPDQRIAAVGYALMADAVRPGGITAEMLASNTITLAQLSPELRQTIEGLQAWQATQLPIVTSANVAEAAVDLAFTYQMTATGSPTGFAVSGLPAGWSVNPATGLITATPAAAGTVTLSLTAINVAGTSPAKSLIVNVTGPVFVDFTTGLDGNDGTQAAPVKTVSQGISIANAAAAKRSVRVSGAAQTFTSQLAMKGGVAVRGGYDRAAGWTRTAPRTPLNYAPSGTDGVAVVASDLTAPTLLDGFAITSATPTGAGQSSVGVRVRNCPQEVTISNNTITAGNGAAGLPGSSSAAAGVAGAGGWDAVSWRGPGYSTSWNADTGYCEQFHCLGLGGTGMHSVNFDVSPWEGYPGMSGGAPPNGTGGIGGAPGTTSAGNGSNGTAGGTGTPGTHGVAGTGIHLSSNFTSDEGGTGSAGGKGWNGGNGGGGGGITDSTNSNAFGGGGGSGGSPGTGGGGSGGGKGAGGAFAVMVVNSKVTVTGCTLTTGNGGTGGAGGGGANGGAGGAGGTGFVTPAWNGTNPGNGGNGGAGGAGGGGGGGAGGQGGPAIGIIASANSTLTQTSNAFTLGTAGTGGPGGLRGGSATSRAPSGPNGPRQNVKSDVQP